MKPKQVFYWRGLCRRATLSDHDKSQLQRFVQGERQNLDFEPVGNDGVFCIRSSDERRILFTVFTYQNKEGIQESHPLVLEVLEHHGYDRAWCLQPRVASRFLNKHSKAITKDIHSGDIGKITNAINDPFTKQGAENIELVEVDRYHGEFILLSDEQKAFKAEALKTLPAMLLGPAGSGKTSTAFSFLLDFVDHYNALGVQPEHPIAYISDNPNLIDELKEAWHAVDNPAANTPAGERVIFITSNQMLDMIREGSPDAELKAISTNEFSECIRKYIIRLSKNNRQHPLLTMNDIQLVHEGGIAAACSKEKYLALGEFESNLNNDLKSQRGFYWDVIDSLRQALKEQKQYMPGFYHFKRKICFSMSIYDEAQSGLLLQKLDAMRATEKSKAIFCLDPLQSNGKPNPDVSLLKKILGTPTQPVHIHELKVCFRSPEIITRFAQEINHMRLFLNGGLDDAHSRSSFQGIGKPGSLRWLDEKQLAEQSPDEFNNIDTAVVTHAHLVEEARRQFQTGLVFTAINIGGLQFKNIVLYRYTESEAGLNTSRALATYDASQKVSVNLPKAPKNNADYSLYCSAFHTGITRAMETLTLVESPCNKQKIGDNVRRHLLSHLKKTVDRLNADNAAPHQHTANTKAPADKKDWESRVAALVKSGHTEQAKMAWVTNLKRDEASFFEHFQLAVSGEKKPVALIKVNHSDALVLSANRIKESFKWKNYLEKWTKPDAENKTAPMLVRVLLEPKSIKALISVIPEKPIYKNMVFKLFDSIDFKQDIIYQGITLPLIGLILSKIALFLAKAHGRQLLGTLFRKMNDPILLSQYLPSNQSLKEGIDISKTKKQTALYLLLQIEESYPILEEYFITRQIEQSSNMAEHFYNTQAEGERWNCLATLVNTEAGQHLLFRLMCERKDIMGYIPLNQWGKPGLVNDYSVFTQLFTSLNEAEKERIKTYYTTLYMDSQKTNHGHLIESHSSYSDSEELEFSFSSDEKDTFEEEDTWVIENDDDSVTQLTAEELIEKLKQPNAGAFLAEESLEVSAFESFISNEEHAKTLLKFMNEASNEKIISMIQFIDFNKIVASHDLPLLYFLLFTDNGCALLAMLISRVSRAMFNQLDSPLLYHTVFSNPKHPETGRELAAFVLRLSIKHPRAVANLFKDNPDLISSTEPLFWLNVALNEVSGYYSILLSFLLNVEDPDIKRVFLNIMSFNTFEIFKKTELHAWLTKSFLFNGKSVSYIELFDMHDDTRGLVNELLNASTYEGWLKVNTKPNLMAAIDAGQTPLYLKMQAVKKDRLQKPPQKLTSTQRTMTLHPPKKGPAKAKPKAKGARRPGKKQ